MNERLLTLESGDPTSWTNHTVVEMLHNDTLTPDIVLYLRKYRTDQAGSILSASFTPAQARELAAVLTQFADVADHAAAIYEQQ